MVQISFRYSPHTAKFSLSCKLKATQPAAGRGKCQLPFWAQPALSHCTPLTNCLQWHLPTATKTLWNLFHLEGFIFRQQTHVTNFCDRAVTPWGGNHVPKAPSDDTLKCSVADRCSIALSFHGEHICAHSCFTKGVITKKLTTWKGTTDFCRFGSRLIGATRQGHPADCCGPGPLQSASRARPLLLTARCCPAQPGPALAPQTRRGQPGLDGASNGAAHLCGPSRRGCSGRAAAGPGYTASLRPGWGTAAVAFAPTSRPSLAAVTGQRFSQLEGAVLAAAARPIRKRRLGRWALCWALRHSLGEGGMTAIKCS